MLVVSKPRGQPIKMKLEIDSTEKSYDDEDIAKALQRVNKGPKAKKIVSSPRPFLPENLRGFAV